MVSDGFEKQRHLYPVIFAGTGGGHWHLFDVSGTALPRCDVSYGLCF